MLLEEYFKESDKSEKTSIIHLLNSDYQIEIDLISIKHIGRPQYYNEINEILFTKDIVLYEGRENLKTDLYKKFAKEETIFRNKQVNKFIKNKIKKFSFNKKNWEDIGEYMKRETKLISQTEGIDYSNLSPNWILSDLSNKEIVERLKVKSLIHLLGYEIANQFIILPSFFLGNKIMNSGLNSLDKFLKCPEIDLINRKREQKIYSNLSNLEKENNTKKIGILYGAHHMPFIEQELKIKKYFRIQQNPIEYIIVNLTISGALIKAIN